MSDPINMQYTQRVASASQFKARSRLSLFAALALASTAFVALSNRAYAAPYGPPQVYGERTVYGDRYDYDPRAYAPPPRMRAIQGKSRISKKATNVAKAAERKPEGPLTIVVSIARQHLTLYDAHGVYAESPVSTGMAGHATPLGVFSVIQKDRFHKSNIYSNAPMPFMQRITWSGIAIHQGVLPGYPASHGCIRMPAAFAVQMWGWTKLGARVVIVPDEVQGPHEFSNPLLVARIVEPQTEASKVPAADGMVDVDLLIKQPKTDKSTARVSSAQTADATEALHLPVNVAESNVAATAAPALSPDDKEVERRIDAMVAGKPVGPIAAADEKHTDEVKTADATELRQSLDTTASDVPASANKPADKQADAKPADSQPAMEAAKQAALPSGNASTGSEVVDRRTPPVIASTSGVKSAVAEAARRRPGQIAIFISRKERRLYVRQNMEPLFDVPVTIADIDRPLGTHVFTARTLPDDPKAVTWTAMTMPELAPRRVEARVSGKGTTATDAALPGVSNANDALNRITIPKDTMDRIASLMSTGSSLIVSDKGMGGETGEGTDFIIPLR